MPHADSGERARIGEGISKGEFSLAYQPIVDVHSAMAVGAEALLRWRHPQRGWLHPGSFEQILHTPGVAWDMTAFVIDRIFTDFATLPYDKRRGFVSFNVYPSQLHGGRLKELIETHYLARGAAPESLVIELLESETHVMCDELIANVQGLRSLGLRVAIDDFGAGAWTLTDLTHLEVDMVKLARELICQIPSSDAAMIVVAGTLRVLDALGTQVIAEGVETDE
jgi:EAL domain-containing protein (putative c-di-GMP-specific phosphodiesterase class I)